MFSVSTRHKEPPTVKQLVLLRAHGVRCEVQSLFVPHSDLKNHSNMSANQQPGSGLFCFKKVSILPLLKAKRRQVYEWNLKGLNQFNVPTMPGSEVIRARNRSFRFTCNKLRTYLLPKRMKKCL